MFILKILAFVFIVSGAAVVFLARCLVTRYNLDKNIKCDFENEMTVEELERYKYDKAVVNLKMLGMLIILPGVVLVLFAFK